ncbi:MAG: hypothetical protein FJ214_05540 [Ignavibacteria bacterium]|nr:hypothetical protein [Ignavibacteria bacterium]
MQRIIINFSFPYKTTVLIFSAVLIFLPIILIEFIDAKSLIDEEPFLFRSILLIPTFIAMLGFIYCTLGYHFQILRGDELKLRIHLESLNITFTTTLISMFILIFMFLNFSPTLLNYILVILSVIAIISYVVGIEIVKEKYK